jgi:menaquinone-9 beta-reductase
MKRDDYDVVVVGASIAGCTAAILYGRAGLRVALVERNRRRGAYKAMCGHVILGGTHEVLQRTGLRDEMLRAGAAPFRFEMWNGRAWVHTEDTPPAISLRRSVLDPLLRRLAAATAGVDLLLGHTVDGLVPGRGGRIEGVTATGEGSGRELRGRLVVAADGHRSAVARLAGVKESVAPNERFLYWSYYDGLRPSTDADVADRLLRARAWFVGPDVAVMVPTDEGLTLVGVFATKSRLDQFGDRSAGLETFVGSLPDAPDLARGTRVSKVIGTSDYPFVRRHPTPCRGLALIGDAATASDPVPAVGCGWAFRTADWLATSTAPALLSGDERDLRRGLRQYRRNRAIVDRYDRLARTDAKGRPFNPVQRALFDAAEHDADVAGRLARFAARSVPPSHLLNPATVLRALRVQRVARRRTHARADAASDGAHVDGAGEADALQEPPVVADQHEGAVEALQRDLELLDGGQVEVVGGLVEHQQVHPLGHEGSQLGAGPLPGGELPSGAPHLVGTETELGQQRT